MKEKVLVAFQKRTDDEDMPCVQVTANHPGCPPFFKRSFYDQKEDGKTIYSAKDLAEDCIAKIQADPEGFFDQQTKSRKK
jgi:hypothetical protein